MSAGVDIKRAEMEHAERRNRDRLSFPHIAVLPRHDAFSVCVTIPLAGHLHGSSGSLTLAHGLRFAQAVHFLDHVSGAYVRDAIVRESRHHHELARSAVINGMHGSAAHHEAVAAVFMEWSRVVRAEA